MSIEFIRVGAEDKRFDGAIRIYEESFPPNERHPSSVIKGRVKSGKEEMFVGLLQGEVVLMALIWPLKSTDFILLDYIAVKKQYRGQSIGSRFMSRICDLPGYGNKIIILEVENPGFGENREQRQRRVSFYRALGALELSGVRYILPPLSGAVPTDMILMVLPMRQNTKLQGDLVRKIVLKIYGELYGLDEGSSLVRLTMSSIQDIVEAE
jgi:GNAT superfamily N-acetyltransferase